MGHGFLGMERDPWPPAIDGSDSDPVVTPKKNHNTVLWLVPRVVIGVFLALIAFAVYAHFATVATTNMRTFGPRHTRALPQ